VQRGVTYQPVEQKEMEFAWGLGNARNNEAEALVVLQGLSALKDKGVRKATVIGKSLVTL
jgi:ribonuclease HI